MHAFVLILNGIQKQVLAFKKAGGRLALSLYVILHNASGRSRECPKKMAHYMILQVYTVMIWGDLVEVWGWFWVVWGVSMDRTTVMLTVK